MQDTQDKEERKILIRRMLPADAAAVAVLHRDRIGFGFLSSLGLQFLSTLYCGIQSSKYASCWVAAAGDVVVGFAAATSDVQRMYEDVLRRIRWRLFWALLPSLASPRVWRYGLETLRYPASHQHLALPRAELLSIAISDRCARGGIGRQFIDVALNDLWSQGITDVRVAVAADLPANSFYRATGWVLAATTQNHGRAMNLYVQHRPATWTP